MNKTHANAEALRSTTISQKVDIDLCQRSSQCKYKGNFFIGIILISGCGRLSQYALEDVEKQRLKSKNGDEKALQLLTEMYKDNNQSYDVRLAAIRALSESRDPKVIHDIQG